MEEYETKYLEDFKGCSKLSSISFTICTNCKHSVARKYLFVANINIFIQNFVRSDYFAKGYAEVAVKSEHFHVSLKKTYSVSTGIAMISGD